MKKLFALTLAVVMALAVASSAMAFSWGKPADKTADDFANRYKIEVVKLANETGIIGTSKLIEAPGATAVNNAAVYYYIRLTITGASGAPVDPLKDGDRDAIQMNARAKVTFTALNNTNGIAGSASGLSGIDLSRLTNGVYYYDVKAAGDKNDPVKGDVNLVDGDKVFKLINGGLANSVFSDAAIEARCLDTATAKVYAKVSAERPLPGKFNYGSYDIDVTTGAVAFYKASSAFPTLNPDDLIATFNRDGNGKVTEVTTTANAQDVIALYQWLNAGSADTVRAAIANGEMYMTNGNIRAAFGFDYKGESSITWNANPTAIILDPTIGVGIPKTGDNASIIGFALVMIAVVGAAVAVKKVRA